MAIDTPLSIETWTTRAKRHTEKMTPFADAFLERRSLGQTHPVHDFLFVYYNCSPLKLKQWVPSFEEKLIVTSETLADHPWLSHYWFRIENGVLTLDRERIQESTRGLAAFVATLCSNILQRAPRFGCFGLHEWAMVYKISAESLRHQSHKLRLSSDKLANFVESQTLCCSHYDAYRFFTKEAQPLNTLKPDLETRLQMEQGGCVHANMDLYKWAVKLWPWVGSDYIAKAFSLAFAARELDMRASPYDLSAEGYEPICIETEAGRKHYQAEQQQLTEQATPLRQELLEFCLRLGTAQSS